MSEDCEFRDDHPRVRFRRDENPNLGRVIKIGQAEQTKTYTKQLRKQEKWVNLVKKPCRQRKTAKDKEIKDCKCCGLTHNHCK